MNAFLPKMSHFLELELGQTQFLLMKMGESAYLWKSGFICLLEGPLSGNSTSAVSGHLYSHHAKCGSESAL